EVSLACGGISELQFPVWPGTGAWKEERKIGRSEVEGDCCARRRGMAGNGQTRAIVQSDSRRFAQMRGPERTAVNKSPNAGAEWRPGGLGHTRPQGALPATAGLSGRSGRTFRGGRAAPGVAVRHPRPAAPPVR